MNLSMKTAAVALAVSVTFAGVASADGNTATTSASASAHIVTPIEIAKVSDLAFGNIAAGTAGTTVVMTPGGVRTCSVAALCLTSGASASTSAASFNANGESGFTYNITLPGDTGTVTDGTNTMSLTSFTMDFANPVTATGENQLFSVGATLGVGASQVAGAYSGTFDVTVTYN